MQKVLTDLADNDSNRTESRTAWRQAASSSVVRRKLTAWSHPGRVSKIIRKNCCSSDCCNTIKLFFKLCTRQRTGRVATNNNILQRVSQKKIVSRSSDEEYGWRFYEHGEFMFGDYWKIVYRGKPRNLEASSAIEELFDFHKIALDLIRFIVITEFFSSIWNSELYSYL